MYYYIKNTTENKRAMAEKSTTENVHIYCHICENIVIFLLYCSFTMFLLLFLYFNFLYFCIFYIFFYFV